MRQVTRGRARIGCSGWEYADWRGNFYPADLPRDEWLAHYAQSFETVEINSSFYRLPEPSTVRRWRARVPDGFCFAFKASRYLTHMKKLKDPEDPLHRIVERAAMLGDRLGPILYQLPPGWKLNASRLRAFLDSLPSTGCHTVEFRDASWYDAEVFEAMAERRVSLCLHDMPGSRSPRLAVGPFVYVRFHGVGAKYGGSYSPQTLRGWADWLGEVIEAGKDVYVYFNNDVGGHAPNDASKLRSYLGRRS